LIPKHRITAGASNSRLDTGLAPVSWKACAMKGIMEYRRNTRIAEQITVKKLFYNSINLRSRNIVV
jgi:hypothetical protein